MLPQIEYALYKYRLLVVRDQPDLRPESQYRINCLFDPDATGKHGVRRRSAFLSSSGTSTS